MNLDQSPATNAHKRTAVGSIHANSFHVYTWTMSHPSITWPSMSLLTLSGMPSIIGRANTGRTLQPMDTHQRARTIIRTIKMRLKTRSMRLVIRILIGPRPVGSPIPPGLKSRPSNDGC
jgi:hypothetical protein